MDTKYQIAPSLFSSKISNLENTLTVMKEIGIQLLHIDVMDGHFVPDMAFGPSIVNELSSFTDITLDVHLMVDKPEKIVERFADLGADMITFHIEATNHAMHIIQLIKSKNKKVGVAINPATPIEWITPVLNIVDVVLVMTINPGTLNQSFIPETLKKIETLKNERAINGYRYLIEVDGKINPQTIKKCAEAGADIFVSGGYIFESDDDQKYKFEQLYHALSEVNRH